MNDEHPALFFYEHVIQRLVVTAKFAGSVQHATLLMQLAKRAIFDSSILTELAKSSPSCVSAVPTHWLTRLERGVDLPQAFGLMLSRALALPFVMLLTRTSYFHRQSLAANKAERLGKITGVFALKPSKASYERVVLVDDIVTTGATFAEAKRMLKLRHGKVSSLALARTP